MLGLYHLPNRWLLGWLFWDKFIKSIKRRLPGGKERKNRRVLNSEQPSFQAATVIMDPCLTSFQNMYDATAQTVI